MIAGTSSSGASCVARCTIDAVKIAAAILFSLAMTSSQVCLREHSTSSRPPPRSPRRLFEHHAPEIEAQIIANAEPTVEAIAVKLRMMAWHMRYEEGGLNGERPPTKNENTITSALAAAESIIRRART